MTIPERFALRCCKLALQMCAKLLQAARRDVVGASCWGSGTEF
jgi:hypothetical protein